MLLSGIEPNERVEHPVDVVERIATLKDVGIGQVAKRISLPNTRMDIFVIN